MSGDLVAFLAARLDEDERKAIPCTVVLSGGSPAPEILNCIAGLCADVPGKPDNWKVDASRMARPEQEHLARQHERTHADPQALREVEAKRAILAIVEAIPHRYIEDCYYSCELAVSPDFPEEGPGSGYCNDNAIPTGGCTCGRDALVARIRAAMATIWLDHPDYDPEWKP